ncbi:hypothetical protein EXE53_20300, partial [Halorubrum sp. SD626R]|uniref:hypothetical protein n=1 Tax=Halorubrum sp. SD626R TaxID=1419722 RepID=UPI0010F53C68
MTVTLILVVVISLIGATKVSAESVDTKPLIITQTGDPEDIFPHKNAQNIFNVSINHNLTGNDTTIQLYIDTKSLDLEGVDLSEVKISEVNVSNASVDNIDKEIINGSSILSATFIPDSQSGTILVQNIKISGINSSRKVVDSDVKYDLKITSNSSDYEVISRSNNSYATSDFKIAAGSLNVVDQATGSTYLSATGSVRSRPGITISNPVTNVNSTIVVTSGAEKTKIEGTRSYSADDLNGVDNITLGADVGGRMSAYLIPTAEVHIIEDGSVNYLSNSSIKAALSHSNFHVFLGSIQLDDQEFDSKIDTKITIAESELLDGNKQQTPYIVSLHPVTTAGKIKYDISYGYTNVLTGINHNTSLYLRDQNGLNNTIWHSNKFAASIRLARGHSDGENVKLNDTRILRNTDIYSKFVGNGVSDGGIVSILEEFKKIEDDTCLFDSNYTNTTFYSSQKICVHVDTDT